MHAVLSERTYFSAVTIAHIDLCAVTQVSSLLGTCNHQDVGEEVLRSGSPESCKPPVMSASKGVSSQETCLLWPAGLLC